MRIRTLLVALSLLSLASVGLAQTQERWLMVAGTAGTFHTDVRLFNPSFEKDIVIRARFVPAPTPPSDNRGALGGPGATFTVPKRTMHVLNDVTTALFGNTPTVLGAIQFTSDDPFEVTSRIYSLQDGKTVGQFGPGVPTSAAKTKGAVLQIRANGVRGQVGTFRTNIGVVNPNDSQTSVAWRLYDRNNAVAGTGTTMMPPYGVTQPLAVIDALYFQGLPGGLDLSDAWVSFTATNPIFVYASVLDNGTEDQTFVPAVDDVGVAPQSPPPQPTTHTFDVTLEDWSITFSPAPTNVQVGDTVRLRIRRENGIHGFQVTAPNSTTVVPDTRPTSLTERTFTATEEGLYTYFCTVDTCGIGHASMYGTFNVGRDDGPGGPGY
ncbi:MAG TPA: hypothetical protein VM779_07950 [Thermoanaerobaculia bacterium]|nr:hypothetical protein [Thermoanaerobaculia bacterium]